MAALVPTARRVRTAAAAAVLGIGTFGLTANTAAFAQSDQFKGQTLTVQHNPISSNKAGFETYYKAIAAEFAKQTGATVKYVTSAQSINEQMPQIMATHAGPDVIGASSMEAAWQSDAFMKFTDADWKVLGGLDQFPPGQLGGSGPAGWPLCPGAGLQSAVCDDLQHQALREGGAYAPADDVDRVHRVRSEDQRPGERRVRHGLRSGRQQEPG